MRMTITLRFLIVLILLTGITSFNFLCAGETEFYPGGTYDENIPAPGEVLGYEIGEQPARYHEMVRYLRAVADASSRVRLHEYGSTYENRTLYYAVISSEENLENLESIRRDINSLANPKKMKNSNEVESLVRETPLISWLMYSIHGDELSSTDAALRVLYQLAAGTDSKTGSLLDNMVICIDPLQNPDGRERFLSHLQQWQSREPNPDGQSIQHTSVWPWGRGNHFLFDLNRDWFLMVNRESRDRVQTVTGWNPQLVVDSHEMGGYDTYLFPPAREPINRNINTRIRQKWIKRFARDHASAFDRHGWSYYTKEWNDDWYPGYGSSWARYFDAVGILYEQAGVDGTLLKRPDGTVLTYRESVHHHFVSSLTNLTTALEHKQELLRDYYLSRQENLNEFTRDETKVYYIFPGDNRSRAEKLIQRLLYAGVEVKQVEELFTVRNARGYWEDSPVQKQLPAGTYIISLAQPARPYINAILEFDPRMVNGALQQERESLLKKNGTTMYEVTSWSMPEAYGLEAYTSKEFPDVSSSSVTQVVPDAGALEIPEPKYGYLIPFRDDSVINALVDLLEKGYTIRVANKPFEVEDRQYTRGTLLLRLHENPESLHKSINELASMYHVKIYGVNTALSDDGPDLGGREFDLLVPPKIALLSGPHMNLTSLGSLWYLLDQELKIRYSILDHTRFANFDLRKYNTLILPSASVSRYGDIFGGDGMDNLKTWVKNGGTLIAVSDGAAFMADSARGFSKVALRRQVLEDMEEYQETVQQEMLADQVSIDSVNIWEGGKTVGSADGQEKGGEKSLEELKREDERMRLFMPRGAFMHLQLNPEHWLAFGLEERVPAMVRTGYTYLTKDPVETVGRFADAGSLRISGLLWPEARQRWAESAYLTRESSGKGQIILFAEDPFFRGYTYGTGRLLINALLLAPGLGATTEVPWGR